MHNKGNNEPLMPDQPVNVTVRLKRGPWEIEITSPADKIQEAVESVLAGMASKEPLNIGSISTQGQEGEKHYETCRGLLLTLWREGWFAEPRQLSDVHDEMARRGYHYDRTAVAHALVDLVREGTLFREGSMRSYRYVQKHPSANNQAGAPTA